MPGYLYRRVYILKRDEHDPERSKIIPEEGIPAYRDISRFEENEAMRSPFVINDLIKLHGGLIDVDGSIFSPVFDVVKRDNSGNPVRTFIYVTTEFDIRMPIEHVPIEEFLQKPSEELLEDRYIPLMRKLMRGTGVFYPYYLVEPGEVFYIPYVHGFAIALRKFRFRGLLLKLGRIGTPEEEDISEYLEILRGARTGIDKLIFKPIKEERSD